MTRKMKDSGIEWIGEIPEDWEIVKIKHEYSFSTGFTPETNRVEFYCDESGYEWLNISDLDGSKFLNKQTKNKISKSYVDLFKPKSVPKGSLMYSFKLSVGQRAFSTREMYTNEAIASFVKMKDIDLNYFYYSSSLIEYNSNTNIYGARILNQELIKNAPVPFPSIMEQNRISNFLDKKTEQIEKLKNTINKEIENLENYKKSVITEVVTKGLDKNVEMKDSGIEWIGEIPKHWEIIKIKDAFTRKNSKANIEKPVILSLARSGIKIRDISNNEGQLAADYSNYNPVDINDLLLNPMDLISGDNCNISKVKGVISPAYINLRFMQGTNPEFYNLYFKNLYWSKVFFAHGKGVSFENRWTLNYETLSQMKIPYPPILEQDRIADYLVNKIKTTDDTIANKQKQLESLEEYKKSLIYEYVTGKKEVKDGEES
ncbi:MAG: restriction endonuclease subunit S [Finegoldia magna]|uniref:restriction endonuclease subunit S n=1 Tax=Finegoldia magna TaxID=1260 RepID=UPI0026F2E0EC|nr:restriction endonuclease subunit S [Finegoldia magna]MBS5966747.1 restriction endonuclease subunit S [Finegoldia magna]